MKFMFKVGYFSSKDMRRGKFTHWGLFHSCELINSNIYFIYLKIVILV